MKTLFYHAGRTLMLAGLALGLSACATQSPSMQSGKMSMAEKCACCAKMKSEGGMDGCCCSNMGDGKGMMCAKPDMQMSTADDSDMS